MSSPEFAQFSTRRTTARFQRAAGQSIPGELPPNVQTLVGALQKFYHWTQDGMVHIPLHRSHMGAAPTVVRAVMADPSLKSHIVFHDKGAHAYDEVVWDLTERGLELARALFREQAIGKDNMPQRIIITPPVIGRDSKKPNLYRCADVMGADKNGDAVKVMVMIKSDVNRMVDKRQLIQTNSITLDGMGKNFGREHILSLSLTAAAPCAQVWMPSVAHTHEYHV